MSGRGTAAGVVFQAEVGAYAAALILGERPISRLSTGLPGNPIKVNFETPTAVDDVVVRTNVGEIYVQAKRAISLSAKADSELASVADQFVRQFRAGVIDSRVRRDLEPARDRLLLVVEEGTGDPIAIHLKEVFDRYRTGAATALPTNRQTALETFLAHVDTAWLSAAGTAITDAERTALLRVCAVASITDASRQLAEEALRDVLETPGSETAAMDLLVTWAANSSAEGTGGDTAAIRLALSATVSFAAPPSYRNDVEKLLGYSAATMLRLERFASLATPEGLVTIPRPITAAIALAAASASLAITGEPGGGKSAVMYETAKQLPAGSAIVLAVEASATSLDALRGEIGLQHPLIEVLANLPGPRPSYLFLDALDAVRGGAAEATYRKLAEAVSALPGWRVVASVRTFDLRLGREWQRVFRGNPPDANYVHAGFPTVRHMHVGVLNAAEIMHVTGHSPSIATAIAASGSRLAALSTNPFNLALLGDLLTDGVTAAALSSVGTRGELLARYWNERITGLGTPATVTLRSLVDLMVQARSVDLPVTSVPIPAASTVDDLQHVGVLTEERSHRLAFRHHVLFDYAVARLLLMPDWNAARSYVGRASGAGLLISPSVAYWIEDLKTAIPPDEFWKYAVSLIGDDTVDPIIKIEFARLVVESVKEGDDLGALLEVLPVDDMASGRPFQHLAGSLLTRAHNGQPIVVGPWAGLLAMMVSPGDSQISSMSALIGKFLESNPDAASLAALGKASRVVFDWISQTDSRINWLAPRVIPFVARTFGTDPAASGYRLRQVIEGDRFARVGYIEVPWLSRETLHIAPHDEDLVVGLFARVFRGGDFSRDKVTSMGNSWILPMSSNAAQDFGMATYSLSRDFPALLRAHPRLALRALALSLAGERDKDHAPSEPVPVRSVTLNGVEYHFEHDMSYIWAWNIDTDTHDDIAKLYQATTSWFASADVPSIFDDIPHLLLNETSIALVWRTLLDLGTINPQKLGLTIWRTAASPVPLKSLETRQAAINLLSAVYPLLGANDREQTETDWLAMEFSETADPKDRKRTVLATLFQAIGRDNLATEAARDFLATSLSMGGTFENSKPTSFHMSCGEREDTSDSAPADPVKLLVDTLKAARAALANEANDEHWANLTSATEGLLRSYIAAGRFDQSIDDEASASLADALGLAIVHGQLVEDLKEPALATLIALASHQHPELHEDTEANFENGAAWGSPAPRVDVAEGISRLVGRPKFWPQVRPTYERLLVDPHPAVRMQAAMRLPAISLVRADDMWEIMEAFFPRETNSTVLQFAIGETGGLGQEYAARLELIVLALDPRLTSKRSNDPVTALITRFRLRRRLEASTATISRWIADFEAFEERLRHMLFNLRGGILEGIDDPSKPQDVRARTKDLLLEIINSVEPSVRSWPQSDREPTPEEVAALNVFNEIASQIFYAAGHDQLTEALGGSGAKTKFLDEYSEIISKLMTLGTPHSVHHLLELLQKLAPDDPSRCFDLMAEAMLRTTGVARYEHESMGAKLFVDLVGLYLADYRFVFDDEGRRSKLIDCVAVFVEAGWPEARRLFQSLPELLQ
ncbi:hypothetical protein QO004_005046 [Rhizobium mesoamericanum]|uniref:hypothetical protein n=1 Tax=Rhizobium mesoamericanum TaxID=1079800 RepID=UPI00278A7BCB|nr:hypothetical protein [Rhizobium mesoamericanum]MDQ0563237.1 hypothetical protein [Rhizobium mesoamericanum]